MGEELPVPKLKWRLGTSHKKDCIKISQFTKFGVVSLAYNNVEDFQKSEKLETFVWNLGDL